jgi:thioredoxin-like negative regulator of GroEL
MAGKTRQHQIEAMLTENPDDAELHYMLAMEHAGQGDDEGAVRCFRSLFGVAPDHASGYHQAGRVLHRLGRPEEAREVLLQGIAAARKNNDDHAAAEMTELLNHLSD